MKGEVSESKAEPVRVADIDERLVVRQVDGKELHAHLTGPLDLVVSGGNLDELDDNAKKQIEAMRNAAPYLGIAKDLVGADFGLGVLDAPRLKELSEVLRPIRADAGDF